MFAIPMLSGVSSGSAETLHTVVTSFGRRRFVTPSFIQISVAHERQHCWLLILLAKSADASGAGALENGNLNEFTMYMTAGSRGLTRRYAHQRLIIHGFHESIS
jgi:hypothetical protein